MLPTVIDPSVVSTKPESAFTVPSSTKVNNPEVTSAFASASVALVSAEAAPLNT